MRYYKNGNNLIRTIGTLDLPEITKEEYETEMAAINERMEAYAPIAAATSPLTLEEIQRLFIRQTVNTLSIDNQTAGRMIEYFPTRKEYCAEGELIPAKTRVRDDSDPSVIWRSNVDLWNTDENSPQNAPTLWDKIAYHNGVRIIPDAIPATLAWMHGELGYRDGHVYKSGMDGNVYLPGTQGAPWEMVY